MKEEIFEASLTPEAIKQLRGHQTSEGENIAGSPPGRSITAMKEPFFDNERMWSLLHGSYDIHQHSGPSSTTQRLYDELDLAIQGCDMEQGGIVFKNHDTPTTRSVVLVQKVVNKWAEEHHKKKIELYSGVTLNHSVGGLNPDAVIAAYRLGGKYVWMPSLDANHQRRVMGQQEDGIDLIDENDKVVPELKEILALMAETDMILGLCHQSTRERVMVVREAVRMGIQRIEINDANFPMTKLTPEQAKMFADNGAYIGIYALDLTTGFSWDEVMAIYKAVGPERIVLASDCGHIVWPLPIDAMRRFILGFLLRGVPDKDVNLMCKINAHNLLH
ncbi:DUF6282 family protein [Chloroflexota bacterium]